MTSSDSPTPLTIPVGYVRKYSVDIEPGDVVKTFGKVISTRHLSDAVMTDPDTQETYIGDGFEITVLSYDGSPITYLFAFNDDVEILFTSTVYDDDILDDLAALAEYAEEDRIQYFN